MLITSIRTAIQGMREIANQASMLATGLQNAAPPGASLQSVQYLLEIAAHLEKTCHEIEELVQVSTKDLDEKLHQLAQMIVQQETELRKKYGIEDKFRFVRERLQIIFQQIEQSLEDTARQIEQQAKKNELLDDETIVYVYLYNAHGALLTNWQNMLTPKVFYEYSVNRPIYTEKSHIQSLVHSKSNKTQHAYLTIAVKTAHIIQSGAGTKDSLGNPLIKIKEGSLSFKKLVGFTYNEHEYIVNNKGELVKKH